MTTYRAVVKYPVDAPAKVKLAALRDGLGDITAELVREHGATVEQIDDWLTEAANCAEDELSAITPRGVVAT